MPHYSVRYIKTCKKLLNDLEVYNPRLYKKFEEMINEIIENPFKSKFKKLIGSDKDRRHRYGDYRVIYFVQENTVFITKIDWRKDVYNNEPGCPKWKKKKLKSIH